MIDPRITVAREKFPAIKHVIPVVSGKGGVGKSMVSTALALALARRFKTGLLDLDFWGASDHVLLNVKDKFPAEENGILPVEVMGLRFMSVAYYTKGNPLPIRGAEYTDAFLELMTVTRWDDTECLVIDMPPGLADPFLDILKYVKNGEFLVVSTPSRLSINIVKKTLEILKEQNLKILGLIENMRLPESKSLDQLSETYGVKYLGSIPFYQGLDRHLGTLKGFMSTEFFQKVMDFSKML
jgi:ATP-binding protein involved in chromosome partitioning